MVSLELPHQNTFFSYWNLFRNIVIVLLIRNKNRFSSKIGTILPKSGRLDTLQGDLGGGKGGGWGHAPPEKIQNLRSSNCWKCIEIVNLIVTLLFLYHLKYFTIPSGRPFWLLGGACTPHAPPAYRPAAPVNMEVPSSPPGG